MQIKRSYVKLGVGVLLLVISISAGVFLLTTEPKTKAQSSDIQMIDGTQVITIKVNGGYTPNQVQAKAGIPTKLRFVTKNTYDCTADLFIQSLDYHKVLPPTGTTDVSLNAQTPGQKLTGSCSMGTGGFEIDFM